MEALAKAARGADKVLNLFLSLLILLAFAFGSFSLWDTCRIYANAGTNNDLLKFKPTSTGPDSLTLAELVALNPDARAWVTLDDTHIDYPVVQGMTNMDYINTDVFGKYALSGSIFMDCRNAPDFIDHYTLLYGHHMEGGAMFGDLARFQEAAYLTAHPTGTLYTTAKACRLELFACLSVDAFDTRVFDPAAQGADMAEYIKQNALQYREINLTEADRILGLSTCSDAVTNGRTVVFARMTEIAA